MAWKMSITEKKDVRNFVKIILDTDKKTITEKQTFTGYIDKIWRECMADSDAHVVTAQKPNRSK